MGLLLAICAEIHKSEDVLESITRSRVNHTHDFHSNPFKRFRDKWWRLQWCRLHMLTVCRTLAIITRTYPQTNISSHSRTEHIELTWSWVLLLSMWPTKQPQCPSLKTASLYFVGTLYWLLTLPDGIFTCRQIRWIFLMKVDCAPPRFCCRVSWATGQQMINIHLYIGSKGNTDWEVSYIPDISSWRSLSFDKVLRDETLGLKLTSHTVFPLMPLYRSTSIV